MYGGPGAQIGESLKLAIAQTQFPKNRRVDAAKLAADLQMITNENWVDTHCA
jgi:hypothetical protein